MSKLPILKSDEIIKILLRLGFKIIRQSGSHMRLKNILDVSRQTTVPRHNTDIPRWLLKEILKQSKISTKDFLKLLKK